jgi:hypothetical protein
MHVAKETRNFMTNLGIRVFFTAPYGVSTFKPITSQSIMLVQSNYSSVE